MAPNDWLISENGYGRDKKKEYSEGLSLRGEEEAVQEIVGVVVLRRISSLQTVHYSTTFQRMQMLEKDVRKMKKEIADLSEKLVVLEQNMSAVKEFKTEIMEFVARRDETGKSPLGSGGGGEKMVRDWPTVHYQKPRLEIPVFSGEDPCGWILKAEKYFMLYGIEEGDKVAYATLCMEGKALNWLLWMEARNPIHGWGMFKDELEQRFRSTNAGSAHERLQYLRQSTTVAHYREQFELLSAPLTNISHEMLKCAFINGLNDDVKAKVESIGARDLARVMSLAQEIEDKLEISEREEEAKLTNCFGDYSGPNSPMLKTDSKPKEMGETSRRKGGVLRLTEAEYFYKMELGLCFLCDEDDSPNHHLKCKNKHLRLVCDEYDDEVSDEEETGEEDEQETVIGENTGEQPSTFKFLGMIGSREVVVLIGTAATHNFISKEVVTELQLPVERTRTFRVKFIGGHAVAGAEVCKRVVLKTQGIEIVQRFFLLDLANAEVVLGGEWLRTLGQFSIGLDRTISMTFEWRGRKVTLRAANPSLIKAKLVERGRQIPEAESGLMIMLEDEED